MATFEGIGVQQLGSGSIHFEGPVTFTGAKEAFIHKLLQDLYLSDPCDDKSRIESAKGGLLKDSYRWILEHAAFLQWRDGEENRTLWIRGDPGKGKTMLLCGIIDELQEQNPAYVFCQATDNLFRSATAVLRGLLWTLIRQHAPLALYVRKDYESRGKSLFEDQNAWVALSRIMTEVLSDNYLRNKVIIIDALDECITDQDAFLDFIRSDAFAHARLIVSSRNWPEINDALAEAEEVALLSLELNEAHVSHAVGVYIDFKVNELSRKRSYSLELQQLVRQHLLEKANSTFLWVALVCQALGKLRKSMVKERLHAFPAGLKELYGRIMDEILHSDLEDHCRQILEAIAITYRPLYTTELACLVENPEEFVSEDYLIDVIELCRSLIILRPDNSVSFVHQSAKDFLIKYKFKAGYPKITTAQHVGIVKRSLATMDQTLKRNMYGLSSPGDSFIPQVQTESPLASCNYSCVFWINHVTESITAEDSALYMDLVDDDGPVHAFLRRHFMHWLESLSLLKSMTSGISALIHLGYKIAKLKDTATMRKTAWLVENATRLARSYREIIEVAPLQTYMSAYAFIPSNARRELFDHESPQRNSWLDVPSPENRAWSPFLMQIQYLPRISGSRDITEGVAMSPDGAWAAVVAFRASVVLLWNSETGHYEGAIPHDALFITFSPESRHLVSVGRHSDIMVWHVATRSCVGVLAIHGTSVTASIAIIQDGEELTIQSVSADNEIWHWGLGTKQWERRQRLKRDGQLVSLVDPSTFQTAGSSAVTFDHGKKIALLDHSSQAMSIWSSATGECESFTDLRSSSSTEAKIIAGALHGQLVAVGFSDGGIRLWNMAAPHPTHILQGDRSDVATLDINHSGSRISASTFRSLKMWNVETGDCELTASGARGSISSADPLLMVTRSKSTVTLWDVSTFVNGAMVQGQMYNGHLSADGSWCSLITFDDSKEVREAHVYLWDVSTGKSLRTLTLERNIEHEISLLFPRSGKSHRDMPTVAICVKPISGVAGGNSIEIYDIETELLTCSITLTPGAQIIGMNVSPCGYLMAVVTQSTNAGFQLTIWAIETRQCLEDIIICAPEPEPFYAFCPALVCSPQKAWAVVLSFSAGRASSVMLETSVPCRYTGELLHTDSVVAGAFTSDWLTVATGCLNGEIKLWNAVTGHCMAAFDLGIERIDDRFSFLGSGLRLRTMRGIIDLERFIEISALRESDEGNIVRGYGLSADRAWIMRDGERLLWLPADFRPPWFHPEACMIQDSTIAIHTESSKMVFLQLPEIINVRG